MKMMQLSIYFQFNDVLLLNGKSLAFPTTSNWTSTVGDKSTNKTFDLFYRQQNESEIHTIVGFDAKKKIIRTTQKQPPHTFAEKIFLIPPFHWKINKPWENEKSVSTARSIVFTILGGNKYYWEQRSRNYKDQNKRGLIIQRPPDASIENARLWRIAIAGCVINGVGLARKSWVSGIKAVNKLQNRKEYWRKWWKSFA